MALGYGGNQGLIPVMFSLGAAVAAGTNDTWGGFIVPSAIPQVELIGASISNGANISADATDYATFTVQNGSTVMATFATTTALVIDTATAMTLHATVANRRAVGGDIIKVVKTDTANGKATTAQASVTCWFKVGSYDLNAS